MKIRYLSVLACCAASMMLAAPASAGLVGLTTQTRTNAYGISVVELFAQFDQPGDSITAVAGPLNISVMGGTFYQHPSGTDRAPSDAAVIAEPPLACDTFVTIGVNLLDPNGDNGGQPQDLMMLLPGWPGFGPGSLVVLDSGWNVLPGNPQGSAFNADYYAGDGRVLIAQLATTDGLGFTGSMTISYMSGGLPGLSVESFQHLIPGPGGLALLGIAGACGRGRRRR
jgi:hypothetical protein